MAKLNIVVEKVWKTSVRVITNLIEEPVYPPNLCYDTLEDEDAYYISNYGHNPKNWPKGYC